MVEEQINQAVRVQTEFEEWLLLNKRKVQEKNVP